MFRMILITAAMFGTPSFAGTVQCTCPSVNAKGTGNSSCTASESGSQCTVDFNTFDPADEQSAFDLLAKFTGDGVAFERFGGDTGRFFDKDAAIQLGQATPERLVDLLLIYVLVSAVQMDVFQPSGQSGPDLTGLRAAIQNERSAAVDAFLNGGTFTTSSSDFSVLIVPGCIEVMGTSSSYWGMFKAFWSPVAAHERCS